jgi:hypothetical protein
MRILSFILLLSLLVQSCFKEEEMIPPHEQGDLEEGQVALGSLYEHQAYFDLQTNLEVSASSILDWDLSFESAPGGWTIRLNSAKFMLAGNSGDTVFNAELHAEDLAMNFDHSGGDPDSTAMARCFEQSGDSIRPSRFVYLLDRGSDSQGNALGYKKVQLDRQGEDYLLRLADPEQGVDSTVLIRRDPDLDRIYYSFDHGIRNIAPLPDQWSLLFTRYTTMLVTDEGEDYPYLVVGALLNPNGVAAALDTIHDFMDLEMNDAAELEFTTRQDVIGWEWKYYNFDEGLYTIEPGRHYVIRDRDGYFYKLRFVDFYSSEGVKGYPTFEFVRL